MLTGIGAFVFSTFAITLFGDIVPQAYFSRNALQMASRLRPLLSIYKIALLPVAKPTAALLNWWLGPEGITLLRERDFRALLTRHGGTKGADIGKLEAEAALQMELYWHRPVIVTDMNTRMGDVMGRLTPISHRFGQKSSEAF